MRVWGMDKHTVARWKKTWGLNKEEIMAKKPENKELPVNPPDPPPSTPEPFEITPKDPGWKDLPIYKRSLYFERHKEEIIQVLTTQGPGYVIETLGIKASSVRRLKKRWKIPFKTRPPKSESIRLIPPARTPVFSIGNLAADVHKLHGRFDELEELIVRTSLLDMEMKVDIVDALIHSSCNKLDRNLARKIIDVIEAIDGV